jgi:hypothetical protein
MSSDIEVAERKSEPINCDKTSPVFLALFTEIPTQTMQGMFVEIINVIQVL